ncbi:alanine/glycine:cation symporter family protein [Parasutterella secunda]|uniref:alanine/glycine:cation symporter family protein n=1 Tax=Parasutterella secunda TaxID=626947 RepID=UPI0025A465E3|nr:sodium:alanine symporter family protein [Parasutterella secunda]MDM8113159.1 sodium:alanine symporter family protein [Parasutterella secunda]MDM8217776.1 sodium:alanine symporter family protein [Parasutterella secunda]
MDFLNQLFGDINSVLWGVFVLIPLLCGTGIFYTFKLRFVQIRLFPTALRFLFNNATLFGKRADQTGMSSFQALATAVAAQVGTGNVAGAATAIVAGGPGALFWLWVAAFFGMATIFAEAVLAQIYRVTGENDRVVGGPAFYMSLGLGPKFKPMAVFFSAVAIITMGCMGSLVQSNTVSQALNHAFDIPLLASGIGVAILSGVVMFGGMGRLASVTEKLVPFMAGLYLIGGSYVLACHYDQIIPAFDLVFTAAFNPEAVGGGALGLTVAKAMQFGVARGLFSNEAGMGTTPHAHAVAKVEHPAEQGLVAIFGVFTTVLIVTFTVLVILVTGVMDFDTTGIELTQKAYSVGLGGAGVGFVAICLFFFAYSTIIGWYFFSEQNVRYLFHGRGIFVYRLIVCAFLVLGAVTHVNLVWTLSDFFNGIMVIPNVIALLLLHKVVGSSLNDFENKLKKAGLN